MIALQDNPQLHVFSVEAMHTTVTLRLDCPDKIIAQDAVSACWNQLETLEADLSRFRLDSDVSRINHLQKGESLYISECTHACLLKALEMHRLTAGLFDVTLGGVTGANSEGAGTASTSVIGQIQIAPNRPLVSCLTPGRQIDVGGIGKGFALDALAETLASYHIVSALLAAGASTLLAIGPQTWPVALTGNGVRKRLGLQGRALSASGTGIQGAHVVHPDCVADDDPPYCGDRVWVVASDATTADALSTACLLMNDAEFEAFADVHRCDIDIYVESPNPPEIRDACRA